MGKWAERLAALWLQLQGWSVLERRKAGRRGSGIGEVDLIVCRFNILAFVEIKYRPTPAIGFEAISTNQKRRIVRAAKSYLAAHPQLNTYSIRFDAMLIAPWHLPRHIVGAWDDEA